MPLSSLVGELKKSREAVLEFFEAPANVLVKRYAPGKWSVREILCHLADDEVVHVWRISRCIAEPGSSVEGFDQDAWADTLRYEERSLNLAQQLFEAARAQNIYLLEGVREIQLGQTVEHSERGTIRLDELGAFLESHTRHHLEQMLAARDGETWEARY